MNKGVSSEHIFPASQLTPLAIRWQELNESGKHMEAMHVLEEIVVLSTPMFERLAQYEGFQYAVDLPVLVSAAQEKMVKWLLRWQPKKGRLFSWLSTCAKRAFLSELGKVTQFRRRFHVTSDNLEQFYGAEDHEVDKHDVAADVRAKIHGMTCRWGDPQEIGAIRYLIECVASDDHDKQGSIRGAAYAYGISFEQAQFFYAWVGAEMRHVFYEKVYVPLTEYELAMCAHSYDHLGTLMDLLPWPLMKKVMVVMQGLRLRFPPMSALDKLRAQAKLHRDMDACDHDDESIAEVAQKHGTTSKTAQEIYTEMQDMLAPKRFGEYPIYDDDSTSAA